MTDVMASLKRHLQHRLAKNASWILIGQGGSFFLQAAYFVLLARLLKVTEYGVFAGAFALVNIVTPYSSLGSNMLIMRYVSVDRSKARVYWGNALVLTSLLSVVLAVVFYFVGPIAINHSGGVIFLALVLASCWMSQIANMGSTLFQTFEKMKMTAGLGFLTNLIRLLVLVVMQATMHEATALQWSYGVLIASACAAGISLFVVRREIGSLDMNLGLLALRLKEGLGFSFAGTTQSVYNDVDKTLLSHYGMNRENGFYSLAYRIVDFATTPIAAMDAAVLPRYFRYSQDDLRRVFRLALRSTRVAILMGFVIAAGILICAPFVPRLVGQDYSGVLSALKWLCWLPLFRGIHRLGGGVLTATGNQRRRTVAQMMVAVMNLLLNLWLIPAYGWIGAAWSSVASDGLLAVLNTLLIVQLWRHPSTQLLVSGSAEGGQP